MLISEIIYINKIIKNIYFINILYTKLNYLKLK